jgi:putative two-component system response regulator
MIAGGNLVDLRYMERQLSGYYRVMLAKSGEQAMDISTKESPDLILLDIEMPGMDGFETIANLKSDVRTRYIPVIFLTANRDAGTEARALASGARDFITKPFEQSILRHRIELHMRFSDYQRRLENTVKELEYNIGVSFSDLVECRDANTGGHVVRTSRYVEMICGELRRRDRFPYELADDQVDMMVRAAPLHDIGKVSISDVILLKPGRLSANEFEVMKTHTTLGANILQNMYERFSTQRYLHYAIMIAKGHHERYDGSGYPSGKSGDDIPLCAKIMAVADVYDALVDNRVYREMMSHKEACEIIMEERGTHFDPRIVDAFYAIAPRMESVAAARRLSDDRRVKPPLAYRL